jgi:hypothetical protein
MVLVKYVKITKSLKQNLPLEYTFVNLVIEILAFEGNRTYVLCKAEHNTDPISVLSGSSPQQNRCDALHCGSHMFIFVYETKKCIEIFGCIHIVENVAIKTQQFILCSLEIL